MVPMAAEPFRSDGQMAAGWIVRGGAGATQKTTSRAAGATSQAAPTLAAVMPMLARTVEVTGMVATTITTTPETTGEVDFMVGRAAGGAQASAGVGAGAERPGTVTTGIISILTPSMRLQRSGSRTT